MTPPFGPVRGKGGIVRGRSGPDHLVSDDLGPSERHVVGTAGAVAEYPLVLPGLVELAEVSDDDPLLRLVGVAMPGRLVGELPHVGVQGGEHLAGHHRPVVGGPPRMMGLSRCSTADALVPRRERISVRSRSRIRLTAALLGLISSLPDCRRTVIPKKSNPSSRVTICVLSSLNVKPLGANHSASRSLTCSASYLEWHRATRSSAYLIRTGEFGKVERAYAPVTLTRTPAACSIPCKATFKSNGLITPPCGTPSSVGANRPFSMTPDLSHPAINSLAGKVPS